MKASIFSPSMLLGLAFILASLAGGCAGGARHARPPVEDSAERPRRHTLADEIELYVPSHFPVGTAAPDALIHFHGGMSTLQRESEAAGVKAIVVTVNYAGRSGAYERPYSDPERFTELLDDALTWLKQEGWTTSDASWDRVCLSSFSAGYGALRAILSREADAARIAGIHLADSLYAGWADAQARSGANPAHMAPFRAYARRAAAGECVLLLSHSYYDPVEYAGTHVTADDLVAYVGLQRTAVDEAGPGDMRIDSRAGSRGFHVWGCTAPEEPHGRHLRNIGFWLRRLPIAQ